MADLDLIMIVTLQDSPYLPAAHWRYVFGVEIREMNGLESVHSSSSKESETTGWSIQVRKHLHPRILNFPYL